MGSKKYRQLLWREKSEMVVSDKEIRYAIFYYPNPLKAAALSVPLDLPEL
jgi:hypothetical protein